ncbi:MAG: alpha/beta hydrolase [Dehalococcoidia bacterium]
MIKSITKSLFIRTDSHILEAEFSNPSNFDKNPCVILCAPSPKFGGDMNNNVTQQLSYDLNKLGIASFKFNYRGVGNSEGEISNGAGELQDTLDVITFVESLQEIDGSRIGIAGYSFGAWMALDSVQGNQKVKSICSIACPQNKLGMFSTVEIIQPKLFIIGDKDHDFPLGQFNFLTKRFNNPKQIEIITGGDHFFRGKETLVGQLGADFFNNTL